MVPPMRRGMLIAVAAAAGALLAPAVAQADEEIVATTPNRFSTPEVTIDQGEKLTFRNADFVRHDVVHQPDPGQPELFRTPLLDGGETAFVEGSQYLTTGSYAFVCSVHSNMRGTLTVTAAGTPAPRPGAGTAPPVDTTNPVVTLQAGKLRARRLRKAREVTIKVGADEAATIVVDVRVGRRSGGTRKLTLPAAGTRRLTLGIARRARKALRRGARIRFDATATDAAGNPGVATLRKKLL